MNYDRLLQLGGIDREVPPIPPYISKEELKKYVDENFVASEDVRCIVRLTQEEYDALETKDANTLYVIAETE